VDVGRPDGRPVARLDAGGDRRAGAGLGQLGQAGEAQPQVTIDDGLAVTEALGRRRDEAGDAAVLEVGATR